MKDKICDIKKKAIELIEIGLNQNIEDINSKEIYELMDIIKDAEETLYYHKVIESMDKYPEDYMEKYAPDFKNRMFYSSIKEENNTLEDYLEEINEMIEELDSSGKSAAKQKIIQFVNKI